MKFRKLLSFIREQMIAGFAPANPQSEEIKNVCKNAASRCQTIDLISSTIDNHKAMIAAYWCKANDSIIDVGINQANYLLYYQQLVGDTGLLIGYEANPYLYPFISERLKKNSINNVMVRKKAASKISDQKLMMKVYKNPKKSGISTLEPILMNERRMPGKTVMVEVQTECLDELLKLDTLKSLRLIKIDVEGHEEAVLEGAKQLLKTHRPIVIFEYGFAPGIFETRSIGVLEELGYACYDLKTDQRVHQGYLDMLTDIIAIPLEHEKELGKLLPQLYFPWPYAQLVARNCIRLIINLSKMPFYQIKKIRSDRLILKQKNGPSAKAR